MSGPEFKALREECGYSAAELASYLDAAGEPIATRRSVYRMETRSNVAQRYVEALRGMAGDAAFQRALEALGLGAGAVVVEPVDVPPSRPRRRPAPANGERFRKRSEIAYLTLLNAMPIATGTVGWITHFREALRDFLGDVDRVSINVNHFCDIGETGRTMTDMIITEHFTTGEQESVVFVTPEHDEGKPAERLLREFQEKGYPLEQYRPPHGVDYYVGSSYLGTIFLWRELANAPISQDTIELLDQLRPFLTFALSDVVARHHAERPFDRAFKDALANMRRSADLSEQESRVVILQLYGYSYKHIAVRLGIAVDTVRKHIQRIYRKTGTRSSSELFAKYFTHRLGI